MKYWTLLLCAFCTFNLWSQEIEKDLYCLPTEKIKVSEEKANGTTLTLPFFDDFATNSFPTEDAGWPAEFQRWQENSARITTTFPSLPPTIGVATLDALDRTGYPYNIQATNPYGPADTLTSCEIDLSGLSAANNVYLVFYYQGGGFGNAPEPEDSLVLDFKLPLAGEDVWQQQWSVPGSAMTEFERVFIHIQESNFLQDGFQFRFRNYATLSGVLDLWHIDYVFLDDNVDSTSTTFNLVDAGYVYPVNTVLQDFTAMPWSHYKTNPASFMANNVVTTQRNLNIDQGLNFSPSVVIDFEGSTDEFTDGSSIFSNPNEVFTFTQNINDGTIQNYVFDTSVNDTCAVFDVSFFFEDDGLLGDLKDGYADNDSIVHQQVFTNYYAYDDGTAEKAYALQNSAGGKMAMKYPIAEQDTLLGLFIHFIPFGEDATDNSFIIKAWHDAGGFPGEEIQENFGFNFPTYFNDGFDIFGYYEYDLPIAVDDNVIHVGFIQQDNENINIGLDKNTNMNSTRLSYQTGLGANWTQSTIEGTVMIRPVFASGKSFVWNGIDESVFEDVQIYPNPVSNQLTIDLSSVSGFVNIEITDMTGRTVFAESNINGIQNLDVSDLSSGIFIVNLSNEYGIRESFKLIKK